MLIWDKHNAWGTYEKSIRYCSLGKYFGRSETRSNVELAPKAFDKYGAKFLARGYPSVLKENARNERTVVVEFPSVEQAEAFYESDEYQLALEALGDGAVRSYKICEAF